QERPIPSTLPCPWSRHSFFDEASTKVSIDKPLLHFLNGLTQDSIRKSRFLLPSFKGEGFEDVHSAQSLSNLDTNKAWLMYSIELYSTECYRVKLGGPPGRRKHGSLGRCERGLIRRRGSSLSPTVATRPWSSGPRLSDNAMADFDTPQQLRAALALSLTQPCDWHSLAGAPRPWVAS